MVNIKIFDPQFRLTLHFYVFADFICWYDVHVCIIQALGGPREAPCPAAATPGPAKEVEGPAHTVEPKDLIISEKSHFLKWNIFFAQISSYRLYSSYTKRIFKIQLFLSL